MEDIELTKKEKRILNIVEFVFDVILEVIFIGLLLPTLL